jgi:hypothetical protein
MSTEELAGEFTRYAAEKLGQHLAQVVRCIGLLSEEQVWYRASTHCNSVGNLILHLTGNVRQWMLGGLAGEAIARNRPAEFAERGPLPRAEIMGRLEDTVRRACTVIVGLDEWRSSTLWSIFRGTRGKSYT